jgi:membrane-associated protease RseP (regulator of RpoE activity)
MDVGGFMKRIVMMGLPVLMGILILGLALLIADDNPHPRMPMRMMMSNMGGYRLGISLSDLDPHVRSNLKIEGGVMVEEVFPDTPAAKAGIKEGDILLKFDGKTVSDEKEVRDLLREVDNPRPIQVELLRDGQTLNLTVTPEKRESYFAMAGLRGNYIGVRLQELDADMAPYFNTTPDSGVLVAGVEKGSPAEKAGIRSGDIITNFNGKKVTSPEDLRDEVKDLKEGATASITLLRHGKSMNLTVQPEKGGMLMPELPRMLESPDMAPFPDRAQLDDLRSQIDDLRSQLNEYRHQNLSELKGDVQEELQKQIDALRKQLEQLKKSN